ncbi:MAG TPA: Brp/Blh family beta-carotene 15,15'-dioxygenase [Friedmanniella sp.]
MPRAAQLSAAVAASAVLISLLVPTLVERGQLLILVVGFVIGLPHGAVDHLVPFWTGWVRRSLLSMLVVLLGYVGVAGLTWAGLHWAGAVVLPLLLVVSVLHFGAGDLMADHDDDPDARPLPAGSLVVGVLARGGPVVAGPLLVWPAQADRALAAVQLDFTMPAMWVRVLLACVVAACVLANAVTSLRTRQRRSALEVVLLALLFVAVPPLAAFGIYFGAWHGLRHTARLVARDPRNHADLAAGRLLRPLRRFGVSAALPTLVAGGSAAALVIGAGQHTDLTGTVFTVLLALTVPHLVVVAALDLSGLRRPRRRTTALVAYTPT